ncbi:MAG: helix-turn-helix domain-containing protein [Flavobacteriaceae bacterium]|nr:helix-turn-helix domain-containing protein [Flavobacteriaceae bacterium]
MKVRLFLLFNFVLMFVQLNAQTKDDKELSGKSYVSLRMMYDINRFDTIKAKQIAIAYIVKAKEKKDSTEIAIGYANLASVSPYSRALKYLDTTIVYSKNSPQSDFPAMGYLAKSEYLFKNNEYERSLINAISGYHNAEKKGNISQQITALHQINTINDLWGDYRKVLETELFAFKLINDKPTSKQFLEHYLYSIEGIGKCYVRLNKPDSALVYFNKGIKEALKDQDSVTYSAFVSRTGMALHKKGNYKAALDSLNKGDIYREFYNKSYMPYFLYYSANSLYNLGQKEKAIRRFQKIDSLYQNKHVLTPELPLVYDKLASYFKEKENKDLQLDYLYKLIRVERIIDVKRSQIIEKTDSDYHIPKMIKEKETLIAGLNEQNKSNSVVTKWILSFLGISLLVLFYYVRRQIKFKKRFNHLIKDQQNKKDKIETNENSGISITIIEDVMNRLELFESNKEFLSPDISLTDVAKSFDTNSSYLSKVINLKKDKNFSKYINDLRINYVIEQLDENYVFRRYRIKAIASDCGFKNSESFSRAFYKKYGIYPSYYIKQLENK